MEGSASSLPYFWALTKQCLHPEIRPSSRNAGLRRIGLRIKILPLDITLKRYYKVIMNLIAIQDLKQPRRLKERLRAENELLLTSDGRPVAVLVNVGSAEDPESILQSIRDSRSRLALSRIRETTRRTGVSRFTPEQIDREITAVRKTRKTRR